MAERNLPGILKKATQNESGNLSTPRFGPKKKKKSVTFDKTSTDLKRGLEPERGSRCNMAARCCSRKKQASELSVSKTLKLNDP